MTNTAFQSSGWTDVGAGRWAQTIYYGSGFIPGSSPTGWYDGQDLNVQRLDDTIVIVETNLKANLDLLDTYISANVGDLEGYITGNVDSVLANANASIQELHRQLANSEFHEITIYENITYWCNR